MILQVDKTHYNFERYVDQHRWSSYYAQIQEIINSVKDDVVYVGVGDGIVPATVKLLKPSVKFRLVDFDAQLNPDICCDVREISSVLGEGMAECIVCCQILEHIPFEEFSKTIEEIYKTLKSGGSFILSLPDSGRDFLCDVRLPHIHIHMKTDKMCRIKTEYLFDGQHYWEVNSAKKYNNRIILNILKKHFTVEKTYLVPNNRYHRFYVLKKA